MAASAIASPNRTDISVSPNAFDHWQPYFPIVTFTVAVVVPKVATSLAVGPFQYPSNVASSSYETPVGSAVITCRWVAVAVAVVAAAVVVEGEWGMGFR